MAHIEEMLVNGILTHVVKFDHSAQEIDDAVEKIPESGVAPAGYGLGTVGGKDISGVDPNTVKENGWYSFAGGHENMPSNGTLGYSHMFVCSRDADNVTQFVFQSNNSSASGVIWKRACFLGTWGDWECINPVLDNGAEYRTTERYMGKPVYEKLVEIGTLPNAGSITVPIADNIANVTHMDFTVGNNLFNVLDSYFSRITANSDGILIVTVADASSLGTARAIVKYTKTTD